MANLSNSFSQRVYRWTYIILTHGMTAVGNAAMIAWIIANPLRSFWLCTEAEHLKHYVMK